MCKVCLKILALSAVVLLSLRLISRAFAIGGGFYAQDAINSLGVDLLHTTAHTDANALISPYSIELALVMAHAGADGPTRTEMARVLHLARNDADTDHAFAALQKDLDRLVHDSGYGTSNYLITLDVANRLFGQKGYDFRPAFLELVKTNYTAPFEALDFVKDAPGAIQTINDWVASKTQQRIRNIIPAGALDDLTRLVLANALYFKAPWVEPFPTSDTKPLPFHAGGGAAVNVPTMTIQKSFGYLKTNGLTIVTIPYSGDRIQFLIILPDRVNGLAKAEAALTATQLESFTNLPTREMKLYLPKFNIEPPALDLAEALQRLGMNKAFDIPRDSANFDRIAPRRTPNDYLYISRVFHKTFIKVDEKGTEAAAATAEMMGVNGIEEPPPQPVIVRVDHPFIFAIQHRASGACLFLGHVTDPR